eukprot:g20256.t1
MNADLELCQELQGHEKAVRCLCVLKNGWIVTGGVDALVCLFKPVYAEDGKRVKHYDLDKRLHHHSDFVYAVADSVEGDWFYSGGREKTIFKLDYASGNRLLQFLGHDGAVCSLVERGKELYSGSWDGTFRIWDSATGGMIRKVDAGTHAITLCLLPTGEIATGSQDALVKVWKQDGTLVNSLQGHKDIVRKIVYNPLMQGLISCSNDSEIKFWTLDGLEMNKLSGHESFVFDVCTSATCLYSGADDRLLKVWNMENSQCLQSILHSNTIWAVSTLPNGGSTESGHDVVTACADGVVRIFTTDAVRFADEGLRSKFSSDAVAAAAEASKQGAGVPLDGVTDVSEMDKTRGKKNVQPLGEIKMFKTGRTINAYSWNGRGWDLIGEVTGKPKQSYPGDQFFAAGDYDYLFDVEVGEGGKTAKLPYNEGENQLVTAEKFCAREGIHKSMIEQITAFLRQQTGNAAGGAPMLGSSSAGASSGGGSGPSRAASNPSANGAAAPASTPAGVTSASSSSSSSKPKSKHYPVDNALYFDQGKLEAAKAKILEFNAELPDEDPEKIKENNGEGSKKMDHIELMHFEEAVKKLGSKSSSFRPVERDLIWKKCGSWAEDKLFPVVDLWRLYLLHPDSADIFKGTDRGYGYISFILKLLRTDTSANNNLKTPLGISCARWLANVFASFTARAVLFDKRGFLISELSAIADHGAGAGNMHKLVKLSLATALMNLTMVFVDRKELKGRSEMLEGLKLFAEKALGGTAATAEDYEALYRIYVGMGNLMCDGTSERLKFDFAGRLATLLKQSQAGLAEARLKEIAADLLQLGATVQGDDNAKLK